MNYGTVTSVIKLDGAYFACNKEAIMYSYDGFTSQYAVSGAIGTKPKFAYAENLGVLLCAGTGYTYIYKSTDNGKAWTTLDMTAYLNSQAAITTCAIAASDDMIVMCINGTVIYTRTAGATSWTVLLSSAFTSLDYANDKFIVSNGSTIYAISNTSTVTYETKAATLPSGYTGFNSITYGNGFYIGAATAAALLKSEDLITWTVASLKSPDSTVVTLANPATKIIFKNQRFVAIAGGIIYYTSKSALVWSEYTYNASAAFTDIIYDAADKYFLSINASPNVLIADFSTGTVAVNSSLIFADPSEISAANTFITSGPDSCAFVGQNQYQMNLSAPAFKDITCNIDLPNMFKYAGSYYFALYNSGVFKYRLSSAKTMTDGTTGRTEHLIDITYGNGKYVAIAKNPDTNAYVVLTSSGLTTWALAYSSTTSAQLTKIEYVNNTFIILGYKYTVITSTDLTNFYAATTPSSTATDLYNAVVYLDGNYYIGGTSGKIIKSTTAATDSWTAFGEFTESIISLSTINSKLIITPSIASGNDIYMYLVSSDGTNATKFYPTIPRSNNVAYKSIGNMIGAIYFHESIVVLTEYLVILIFLADLPTFTKLNKGYIETSMNDVDDAKTTLNALISSHVTE